ncbi:translation initiation factor IF-2 [Ornatilinea apprima]|uniref:Translation initiation factor IF-2 n=1 Tax=Ornatilinea apprima TaxID=1134406 RepID=A0A0P6X976_9CHLR|nr:translation initiation factor IF-2 [Ornatilinea apprima]KPL79441.1 translation initiation factor IF-2 [Ornatilinea apprima]
MTKMKTLELPGSLTVRELAQMMEASPIQVIKILMANGVMANINQLVDFDTAAIVASEMGFEASLETPEEEEVKETGEIPLWRKMLADEKDADLSSRAPVVTILGHVDHGKTTLLDAIRHTQVAEGEAGGITQHIGAYQVEHNGREITFLDTPGHAAFTAMRARGAQGADIVVLVVAVNDGVMPQTKEAINHARAAKVPIIVALNKIDRPDANPEFVKKQLGELGLVPDEWDGDTIMVPVSAKQKIGIEDLLEAILLVADSTSIRANPAGKVVGTVIEAEIDRSKGVMTTLLVQNGTLQAGDAIVAGMAGGKIRAMFDFRGKRIRKAGPSTPVQIMGLSDVPNAGDIFEVVANEKEVRAIVEERKQKEKDRKGSIKRASLEELFANFQSGTTQELKLIVKADVQGSLEPITNSLDDLNKQQSIKVSILHAETGNITESDIMLAAASDAVVIGFNVDADAAARRLAETEEVSVRVYNIIYRLIEDIEKALKGMLEPEYVEKTIGEAEILAIFQVSKLGAIAGCKVLTGEIRRNAKVHILRGEETVYSGELQSLKHGKDDVREVRKGFECGMGFKNFKDMQVGDRIICYVMEKSNVL